MLVVGSHQERLLRRAFGEKIRSCSIRERKLLGVSLGFLIAAPTVPLLERGNLFFHRRRRSSGNRRPRTGDTKHRTRSNRRRTTHSGTRRRRRRLRGNRHHSRRRRRSNLHHGRRKRRHNHRRRYIATHGERRTSAELVNLLGMGLFCGLCLP